MRSKRREERPLSSLSSSATPFIHVFIIHLSFIVPYERSTLHSTTHLSKHSNTHNPHQTTQWQPVNIIVRAHSTYSTVQCSTVQYSVNEHPNTRWYAYEMQDEMGWCEVRLGKVRLGKVEESESSHYIQQKKKIKKHIEQIQKKYDERSEKMIKDNVKQNTRKQNKTR